MGIKRREETTDKERGGRGIIEDFLGAKPRSNVGFPKEYLLKTEVVTV